MPLSSAETAWKLKRLCWQHSLDQFVKQYHCRKAFLTVISRCLSWWNCIPHIHWHWKW